MPSLSAFIAAILSAFILGLGLGYGAAHKQIATLNHAIETQNQEAQEQLEAARRRVSESQAQAQKTANELDKAREEYLSTTNDYAVRLDSVSLFNTGRKSCSSANATSHHSGIPENATSETELSAELDRLVKEKARIADEAADYAEKAYQFVTINNCGIIKVEEQK